MRDCKLIHFLVINLIIVHHMGTASSHNQDNNSTLQLVHILFRHGERTTDKLTLYPKDPHINETYYPYGLGELTNKGKQMEFRLGKALRRRYDKFLGKIYTPDILEAVSSDTNRTKMSIQLVLAGLFPPVKEQIWETGLNWQPIPYSALPRKQDKLLLGIYCPKFNNLYYDLITSPKMSKEFEQHTEIFHYLSKNSGMEVKTYWDVFFIYMCLKTEKDYGLELPEWTNKVFPKPMEDLSIKSYGLLTATTELKRLASGYFIKKIIDDSIAKINKNQLHENRKLFLYSGHEINIAHLLLTLDVFKPHIPPYGSYLAFELHKINNVNGLKIYYQDYGTSEPQLLKLPACDEFCPLNQFISLVEEYLPNQDSCGLNECKI